MKRGGVNIKHKKIISKILVVGLCLINISTYSFAKDINIKHSKFSEVNTLETNLASMPTPRYNFASTVIGNEIYCIGGYNSSDYFDKVEVYNTRTNTWSEKEKISFPRYGLKAEYVNGKIYVIGGEYKSDDNSHTYYTTVEVYDPNTNTWEIKTPMPTPRSGFSTVVIGNKIYCIGGCNRLEGKINRLNVVEVYDTETDTWETKSSMLEAKNVSTSILLSNKIYCIGGYDGVDRLKTIEVYDTKNNTWSIKNDLPEGLSGLSSNNYNEEIYIVGGRKSDGYSDVILKYNEKDDSWNYFEQLSKARGSHASEVVGNQLYIIGGLDEVGTTGTIESIDLNKILAEESIIEVQNSPTIENLNKARDYVNQMKDSMLKDQMQEHLNSVFPAEELKIEKKISSVNSDIYIKPKNTLSMSLNTNYITFEDFNGVEDTIKENAINLTVESSLPYQINALLETEIQNEDGTNILDKSILGIKSDDSNDYQVFPFINTPITLLDNQESGIVNTHPIDLKLNKGINYVVDIYKTTIKFEAIQK